MPSSFLGAPSLRSVLTLVILLAGGAAPAAAIGVDVTPVSGLVTTEAGGTATFTVVLATQPTADVTIPVATSDPTEGTVSVSSLTFTAADWNVPQTVTVTGVDDFVQDGDIAYTIVLGAATSDDVDYAGFDPTDVAVTNTDDDVAGIQVTPTSGLVTSEAGGQATFTVVLTSQPVADVTVPVASSDAGEGTASTSSLTFTAANWNAPQTVTVTGVDDFVADGDIGYTITLAAASSGDPNYNGMDPTDVSVTNTDNDVVGVQVTPTSGLVTSEAGGFATFTVVLRSQPLANVVIPVASSDLTEGTVSTSSLTFTAANWNVPQTVTVTGVDDFVADGDIAYTVTLGKATSTDGKYSGFDPTDVAVINTDNDTAGISVTPTSGLVTSEAGGFATFNVVLTSQPTANVTIPVSSSDLTEGTVSASSLTFTAANWNVPQTVTVTGVDDLVQDGDIAYSVVLGAATSTDANYSGKNPPDVSVTNKDNDVAAVQVTPTSGLVTTEAGGTATFTVVLKTQPTANVTIPVASSDLTEGAVSTSSLTFTPANWNVAQTVTVTGVDDFVADGNIAYTITLGLPTSSDPIYAAIDPADVAVTNDDNDVAGISVTPTSGLVTSEAGGSATFTVVLTSQPTANVTVPVSSSDLTEGTVSASSLTFTAANWNVPQTVTVTGVDDLVQDGDIAYSIVLGAATSTDANYSGKIPPDVAVTNTDNDIAGITVTPTSGLVTTESGGTASFTVVLKSQPTANVTIPVASSDLTEGTVSTPSLTFTPANWNVAQTVTVTGVDDFIADGNIAYTITLGLPTSSDAIYAAIDPADVAVTNTDNDTPGIQVSLTSGLVTSEAGGFATFNVVLTSQPIASVTIPVSSSDLTEGTVSASSLTFTAANWNVPQTVTVTGVDDLVQDGDIAYSIVLGKASSLDPFYAVIDPADVAVTNKDNDVAAVQVTPTSGLVTTEAGGTATFTVVLKTQPTADVTIPVASSDLTEGTVSTSSLTFTPANWNVAQTVTVTGVDDFVADGNIAYTITLGLPTSSDPIYAAIDPADVAVTNNDNDTPGIQVTPTSGLVTSEAGGFATFNVVLKSQPIADVVIPVASSDTTEGVASVTSLTFTAANWNVAQTVTVTGVDDFVADGNIAYTIVLGVAAGADPAYAGVNPADVSLVNNDNDTAGIQVAPTTGLVTTEAGGTASFTVVLSSQPTANVVIPVVSSDLTEGTIPMSSLTFTPANWNVPQTVTVTGADDFVQDGNISYSIRVNNSSSADPKYNNINPPNVSVVNMDNDIAGFQVTPTSGLVTTEAGGTATFTVVLTSQPTANVVVPVASNDLTEGTVSAANLTFTAANWNVPQTITVTGVDDAVQDGDIAYGIVLGKPTTSDAIYSAIDPADVAVTNLDNDVAGINVTPTSGLVTSEAGGSATFTVVLKSQPTANVTIPVASNDLTEGTVSASTLTFTAANWNLPQTVTVTGVDDFVKDGDIAYGIVLGLPTTADPVYAAIDPADVAVTNLDNDVAGISVTPTSGLVTSEAGGLATFNVVLTSQPTADVTIPVASSNLAEGTVSTSSLTFTAANWNLPQTVTVTGVDDFVADGNVAYTITLGAATSTDPNFAGIDPADVAVTNTDNDVAGFNVTPTAGLVTSEAGGSATFNVVLKSQPTANVVVPVSSSDLTEGTVSTANLTFTAANWNVPQTVTVTGVDDLVKDGDIAYTIVLGKPTTTDAVYAAIDPADVAVTNLDNDVAGVTVTPTAGLVTTEAGGSATFTVVLKSQPTANVVIPVSSNDLTEGTVSAPSLTFTPANWNVPQTVTVTGVDDAVQDGDIAYTVVLGAATSTDPNYAGVDPADVAVTNKDNDVAGVTVTPTSGLVTTEAGGTATFSVVLVTQPTANVVIPVATSDSTEGLPSVASLTFTPANWNVAQTVTVTGVDDFVKDGDIAYTVVLGKPASADPVYASIDPADVGVTNLDNDAAGVTVTPTSGLVTSEAGGLATFKVVLRSQPTANVSIPVASSDLTEGTVSVSSLTFTPANWNLPQTVTVTGVDDFVQDGDIAYTVTLGATTSTDPNYAGVDPADVALVNTDDDVAGIHVSPTSGLITTESGGAATFTVVLTSQPTANVVIPVATSDSTEGLPSVTHLTFTPANWNLPQTVTVTGVDDAIQDGPIAYTVVLGLPATTDALYAAIDPADVALVNADNDIAGVTVSPVAGLVTTEAGGTATFGVVLNTQPTANVVIPVATSDSTEGLPSVASLTFTTANWNLPQTVTVTGVDDAVQDGDIAYSIVLGKATSTDANYAGVDPADVALVNKDNDVAGISVTPTAGLVTSEAGGFATFNVVLNSQPTANVTIPVVSSDVTEGLPSVASLTFTAANWNLPQTVTVTGVDDAVQDGNIGYKIQLNAAASADPRYAGLDPADVALTNMDNDTAGVAVTPAAGLVTTEAGGTATFTVVLKSQPTANVVVPIASSDLTEGTVSPASLTFTPANWNVPRTVTVTGVDDAVQDGDIAYSIFLGKPTTTDAIYAAIDPADVAVTNTDNDVAGFTVTPTAGLVTSEAGGFATFNVVLKSQPTANVVVPISSSDLTEGTVSPASLTFTAANWNVPRTVTVTGVDDAVQDGDIAYTIVLGKPTTTDAIYAAIDPADVAVTNTDNDVAGITVAPVAGLVTTEAGGTATFTVVLKSQPTANVVIPVATSDSTEGLPSVASLTFTAANWNVPQTVTVTGVDDAVQDGDIAYSIVLGKPTTTDAIYAAIDPADVALTNNDNDVAGVTVTPTAGLVTTEGGGTASFTVVLTSQPTGNVVIPVVTSDSTEGLPSVSSLTFTAANWNVPQTVIVTGVDDQVADGNIAYKIVLGAVTSADAKYAGIDPTDVSLTNLDNDGPGFTVTPVSGLTTSESGGLATFTVKLNSQPLANVTIPVASSDLTEGIVSTSSLTFTAANWNVPQTVTVTGVDDQVADGPVAYTVVLGAATSPDPKYAGLDPADVAVTNLDNDTAGIQVAPTSGLVTTEAGGAASFAVVLKSQPTANVVIPVASNDLTEGTVSAPSLTFTPANWSVPQTITVTGVDDAVQDGDIAYTIVLGKPTTTDAVYAAIDPADVGVTNKDNDVAGITVTPTAGLVTSEAGGFATFNVALKSQPVANIVIPVTTSDSTEGLPSVSSLTFTPANWNVPQTVTVTGVDDAVQDGDIAYTIVLGAAASTDPVYAGMDPADVALTNLDNDGAGVTVTPTTDLVTSEAGGFATFNVVLRSQPTADVVIPVATSDSTEGLPSVSSLTFTAANWNVPQTVVVTGVDDQIADGNIAYKIVLGAAASADPKYAGLDPADVALTNLDNDGPGFTVAPLSGLTTSESGGTATFTVKLNSQPLADVTVPVASSNLAEGTVSTSSLTFTSVTWNLPQTVTVTGVDDQVADGPVAYTIVLGAASSADPGYAGVDPADVAVTNLDNDTAGVTVTPTAGLVTSEAGGFATFNVRLDSQPTASVVIPVATSDTTEGLPSVSSLTFTPTDWNVAQTVTVTGVDDQIVDGNVAYKIVLGAATSTDTKYNDFDPADVALVNADNDAPGIVVAPVSGLMTSEAGGFATFNVVLKSQPTANVVVPIASSNTAEGTASPASLTFSAANWSTPQTVTVTGVDDHVVDGPVAYTIRTGAAVSADTVYAGVDPADVAVTNADNDTAGVVVTPVAGLVTTEAGGSATFTMVLRSQPVADVTFALSSSDTTEGRVTPVSVTFTAASWNQPQTVTVTGVPDPIVDGDIAYTIHVAAAVSSDPNYEGMVAPDVGVVNRDSGNDSSVALELVPERAEIEQGEPITYVLAIRNRGARPIDDITLLHTLPPQFGALKGTLSRNGQVIADLPAGPTQELNLPHLDGFVDRNGNGVADPGEPGYAEFRWQLVPGAGAGPGSYTNTVSATAGCATCTVAPPVSATVHVTENTLFTRSAIVGRVFEDRNRDGRQDAGEPGIANARVVLDEGTSVTTDAQGMFHLPDLEGGPRVVKIDLAGLGNAATATTDPSTVVNVAPGLMASVRFGVYFPRDSVKAGRPGIEGLAISAGQPESSVDVAGDVSRPSLQLNGTPLEVHTFASSAKPVRGARAGVQLGALDIPVDEKGRFAASVPQSGGEPFDVAMVDAGGRASLVHVQLPLLRILSPQGAVVLPYGQKTGDVRVAPHASIPSSSGAPVASLGGASGEKPVAWTQVRGRTEPDNAVAVNGALADVAEDGTFTIEVPLHMGENNIAIASREPRGLTNHALLTVTVADRDDQGGPILAEQATPELTLYLPPANVPLQSNALNVAGRTQPGHRVIVNGDTLHVRGDGSFDHRMLLAEGKNHLTFRVEDETGRWSEVTRDLEVRSPKMFLVALADGVVGKSSGAAFLRPGQGESWNEGRIAWNLRGWVAGKYLLTSAFDSQRREMHQLFRDLDDNGRNRLLTNLDPDKLYPVYGDSGSVHNSALDGSRLYVGLEGDAVRASLGNFPIALDDVELAGFRRTLYGAQVRLGRAAGANASALPTGTSIAAFGAQADHVHIHDAIEATGGTLYYLSHDEVTEGSAQVSLVVRDRVTGNVLARVPQRLGADVVVKEFEGRLMFTRPVSSVWDDGSLIGDARLMGSPVTIEVDYETPGTTAEKAAAGGRITQDLGKVLTLGTTVVDDASGAGDYRLRGADFTVKPLPGTRLLAEMAKSEGRTGHAYQSTDGGLAYAESDSAGAASGGAWKAAADLDLGQAFKRPGLASVGAYVRRVDAGFVSESERGGAASERSGGRATLGVGRLGQLSARLDHDREPSLLTPGQVSGSDVFGVQWRLDAARQGAAAEYEERHSTTVSDSANQQGTAALRYWFKPVNAVKATLEHQQPLSSGSGQSSLALEVHPVPALSLDARGSVGGDGPALRGGATVNVNGRQLYVKEERANDTPGAQDRTLFGVQAPLGPMSRAYTEYQWLKDPAGDHALSVTGLEQGWKTVSGLSASVAAEHGARTGETGQHTTVSGVLGYKSAFPLSGSTRAEVRDHTGTTYGKQVLSTTRLALALPSGFSVLGDVRFSTADNFQQVDVPVRFIENSVGIAWRAPHSDAVQLLGKLAHQEDRRATAPGDTVGEETVLGVASLEGTVRLLPGLDWAAKGAARLQQEGSVGLPSALTHSTLWTSRLDYRLVKSPLLVGVEYRMLRQLELADDRSGWLNELSLDANPHMRFGVGYNFSGFSGDPLVRTQDTARGWFIRAQSRY